MEGLVEYVVSGTLVAWMLAKRADPECFLKVGHLSEARPSRRWVPHWQVWSSCSPGRLELEHSPGVVPRLEVDLTGLEVVLLV